MGISHPQPPHESGVGFCDGGAEFASLYFAPHTTLFAHFLFYVGLGLLPEMAALLFRRLGFPGTVGLIGLFSPPPLEPFLVGEVDIACVVVVDVPLVAGCAALFWAAWFRACACAWVEERMNAPGSPTSGFSSIYSLPCRSDKLKDSARESASL
jgi:hypothetical protein